MWVHVAFPKATLIFTEKHIHVFAIFQDRNFNITFAYNVKFWTTGPRGGTEVTAISPHLPQPPRTHTFFLENDGNIHVIFLLFFFCFFLFCYFLIIGLEHFMQIISLTLNTRLWADWANNRMVIFFLFFLENRIWHFMQIVLHLLLQYVFFLFFFYYCFSSNKVWHFMQIFSIGDSLHKISALVCWENRKNNSFLPAEFAQNLLWSLLLNRKELAHMCKLIRTFTIYI